MTEEELAQKQKELREKLRDGRTTKTSASSANTLPTSRTDDKSTGSNHQEAGTTIKGIGVTSPTLGGNNTKTGSNGQRAQDESKRSGQSDGRHSDHDGSVTESNSRSRDDSGSTAKVVIERLDDIPYRDFDYEEKLNEPPPIEERNDEYVKETIKKAKGFFKGRQGRKPLSDAEAKHYAESLPDLLIDYGGYLDKGIAWYSKQSLEDMGEIWGNLSELEAEQLTRILIKRGKRNGETADFIRNMEEGKDWIGTAIIVVPRAMRTSEELKKAPRRPRKGFLR